MYLSYPSNADPLVISFEQAIYEVNETEGQVEVCVILTSQNADIFNVSGGVVSASINIETNETLPSSAAMASEFPWILYSHASHTT